MPRTPLAAHVAIDELICELGPSRGSALALDLLVALRPTGSPVEQSSGPVVVAAHSGEVSPFGRGVVGVLRHLPPAALEDLDEMLRSRLGHVPPATRRQRQLGLLAELIATEATAEIPKTAAYENLRGRRADDGESWPSASELIRDLGGQRRSIPGQGWTRVCLYAMHMAFGKQPLRFPSDTRHQEGQMKPYAMPELVSAAWQMKRRVGFSPTLWEYGMWSAARRQVTRRAGEQERLPSIPVVYRLCRKHNADWPQVSEAASAWGLRGEMRWV